MLKMFQQRQVELARLRGAERSGASSGPMAAESGVRPDIYQILFDEYQTVEYEVLRKTEGVAPYNDFVHFRNNLANYNITYFSLPSLMVSERFDPALDIHEWHTSYKRKGLLKVLKEHGYRIGIFGYNATWWDTEFVDDLLCTRDIASKQNRRGWLDAMLDQGIAELLALRSLPSFVGARMFRQTDPGEPPPITDSAYYCTLKFREMVDRIRKQEAGGRYVFVHMILPHSPHVMDAEGNYVGREKGTRMGQVRLADKLLGELVTELRRLGRYDESLIIVHSDTGQILDTDVSRQLRYQGEDLKRIEAYESIPPEVIMDGSRWPMSLVKSRSQALLLVKPPHHRGYRVDDSPSQLMDIPPTILGAIGLYTDRDLFPEGVDLLLQPPAVDRVRKTYVLGSRVGPRNRLNSFQEWTVQNGRFHRGMTVSLIDRNGIFFPPTERIAAGKDSAVDQPQ